MTFKSFQFIVSILKYHKTKTLRSVFWVGSRRPKIENVNFLKIKKNLYSFSQSKFPFLTDFFSMKKKFQNDLFWNCPFFWKFFFTPREIYNIDFLVFYCQPDFLRCQYALLKFYQSLRLMVFSKWYNELESYHVGHLQW